MHKVICTILLFLLILIIPDLFKSPDFILIRLGVSSDYIMLFTVVIFLIFRVFQGFTFKANIKKVLLTMFTVMGPASVIFTIVNYFTSINYVYSRLLINADKLFFFSLTLGILYFGSYSTSFYKKHYRTIIQYFPFILFGIGIVLWMWPFNKMYLLTKEDSIVEYLQFFVLVAGACFSMLFAEKIIKRSPLNALMYLCIGLCLLFVAGDEISWGQRIMNYSTPLELKNINIQNEMTFHNLHEFDRYVVFGYIILGLYGSIISLVLYKWFKVNKNLLFVFPPVLFFYFFIPAVLNIRMILGDHNLKGFGELSELSLYLGISIFIIHTYYFWHQKKYL